MDDERGVISRTHRSFQFYLDDDKRIHYMNGSSHLINERLIHDSSDKLKSGRIYEVHLDIDYQDTGRKP